MSERIWIMFRGPFFLMVLLVCCCSGLASRNACTIAMSAFGLLRAIKIRYLAPYLYERFRRIATHARRKAELCTDGSGTATRPVLAAPTQARRVRVMGWRHIYNRTETNRDMDG